MSVHDMAISEQQGYRGAAARILLSHGESLLLREYFRSYRPILNKIKQNYRITVLGIYAFLRFRTSIFTHRDMRIPVFHRPIFARL